MPDKEKPQDAFPDKPKEVPLGWLGTNNPPPVQYIRPPSILPHDQQPPKVITQIIKEPSFTQNLYVEVRNWFKARANSFRGNLRADVDFCRAAFRATFAEGWWKTMIAALTHFHKIVNWVLGTGLLALILWLYVTYIYPVVGKPWTATLVLLLVVFGLSVTIRVTRKFYEKTSIAFVETQGQITSLTVANQDLARQIDLMRAAMGALRRDNARLEERLKPNLTIIHKPGKPPFEVEYPGGIRQYRVIVISPEAVKDTELVANEVKIGNQPEGGLHLRERHDRYEAKRIAIKPFKEGVWDVVSVHSTSSGGVMVLLNHITEIEQVIFPVGRHEFELMASGGNNPPATKIVTLNVNADNSVVFNIREGRLSDPYLGVANLN